MLGSDEAAAGVALALFLMLAIRQVYREKAKKFALSRESLLRKGSGCFQTVYLPESGLGKVGRCLANKHNQKNALF